MAISWTRVTAVKVTFDENTYEKRDDGSTTKTTTQVTENVTVLGNNTAVHFLGEKWAGWIGTDKIDEYTVPAGTTTTRKSDGKGGYIYDTKAREAYDVTRSASTKRIGAGKKVVLYTGAYGKKSSSGETWVPKTVTFQFPRWLKNRDVLAGIRVLLNTEINDTDSPTANNKLTPYCRINGVKYRIPTNSAVTQLGKVTAATEASLAAAKDSSEKGKTK